MEIETPKNLYMKKLTYLVLPLAMMFTLSSCDWFNSSILGKPSKSEQELARLEQARKDSLDMAAANLELKEQAEESVSSEAIVNVVRPLTGDRYHVIIGCFKVMENADNMMTLLEENDYTPQKVYFQNDYTCVSAASSDNVNEMYEVMSKMLQADFCPLDIWIYDMTTELHR